MLTRPNEVQGYAAGQDRRPRAVVIGSGFGGLAAAIRLGARGYKVTVLERLDGPGGRAYVFRQNGFTFDSGPTIITAPFLLEELWKLCGRDIDDDLSLKALDPFYTIRFDDGLEFNCSGDDAAMVEQIAKFAPGDIDGYRRFKAYAEELCNVGFEQFGDVPFESLMDMLRIAPRLLWLKSHKTLSSVVAQFVKDPRLQFVLSFHPLFVGGNPFRVTSIYGLIVALEQRWGVHHVMGGTGRLVEAMTDLIAGQGGEILYNSEVREIVVGDGIAKGVRLRSGDVLDADVVVSNADTAWTYRNLLPGVPRRKWTDRRLDKAAYSMSLFVWYFGVDRKYHDIPHHTIVSGPRYAELLDDIFKRKILADDFSLYLYRPTATDPSLAPQGCDTFYVLSPVPNLDSDTDWATMAEPYRRKIEERLSESLLPGFAEHVVTSRIVTPNDFHDRFLSTKGAAFGFEPILTQSAWFRPHNKSEDVKNLFLVGAGTHPGAGVPGVLSSARILDKVVPDASVFCR